MRCWFNSNARSMGNAHENLPFYSPRERNSVQGVSRTQVKEKERGWVIYLVINVYVRMTN